jgi:hypothetical protein
VIPTAFWVTSDFRVTRFDGCICTGLGYCYRAWCECGVLLTGHEATYSAAASRAREALADGSHRTCAR